MTSAEMRHCMAERLRESANAAWSDGWIIDSEVLSILCIGMGDLEGTSNPRDVARLADIIDSKEETCRIVYDSDRDCEVCSNCMTAFEVAEYDIAGTRTFEAFKHCPCCGKRVVAEAEVADGA